MFYFVGIIGYSAKILYSKGWNRHSTGWNIRSIPWNICSTLWDEKNKGRKPEINP